MHKKFRVLKRLGNCAAYHHPYRRRHISGMVIIVAVATMVFAS